MEKRKKELTSLKRRIVFNKVHVKWNFWMLDWKFHRKSTILSREQEPNGCGESLKKNIVSIIQSDDMLVEIPAWNVADFRISTCPCSCFKVLSSSSLIMGTDLLFLADSLMLIFSNNALCYRILLKTIIKKIVHVADNLYNKLPRGRTPRY